MASEPAFTYFLNLPVTRRDSSNRSFSFNKVTCSVFKTTFALENSRPNEPQPPIYIDFAHDTIFLTTPCSSLAVIVSPSCDIKTAVMSIMKPYFTLEKYLSGDLRGKVKSDLRELVFIVGNQSSLLYDSKYPENVRFSEPKATLQLPWQAWGDI
ncbi:hypothetical protein BKA61DRAFT_609789 [Leptodontidium sp. MPI-SDFR-AT-0119]|nr:hypothetical protein BKA61DRAFT_609789 [Leptodontidium sp. MPI-SDFR-AT-0119]